MNFPQPYLPEQLTLATEEDVTELGPYLYRLTNTRCSSDRLGVCEICRKHCGEVFLQTESRSYEFVHDGELHEGTTQHECRRIFGHENCLISNRR